MKSEEVFLLVVLAAAFLSLFQQHQQSTNTKIMFANWQKQFGRLGPLRSEDQSYRYQVFQQNLKQIEEHNSRPNRTFSMGLNQFSDLTARQFENLYLHQNLFDSLTQLEKPTNENLPIGIDIDWAKNGMVTRVKDQGQCKADYAFAGIGAVESFYALKFAELKEFSVQQVIDCKRIDTDGCKGGTIDGVMWHSLLPGVQLEWKYPYTGKEGVCNKDTFWGISGSGKALSCMGLNMVIQSKPIAVTITGKELQNYKSGVIECGGGDYGVSVLLVGANSQSYRLRASFGKMYGQQGFIRIASSQNSCRICEKAYWPS